MVETPVDMDRMGLCDANHAEENEMCIRCHFDWTRPSGIPIDVGNTPVMSIEICRLSL